jgi:hypothetical protein
MVDLSLPEIDYRKYRAPLIGKPYPYQSPIDMQNNLLIRKLLNRKYTYEKVTYENQDQYASPDEGSSYRTPYANDGSETRSITLHNSAIVIPRSKRVNAAALTKSVAGS